MSQASPVSDVFSSKGTVTTGGVYQRLDETGRAFAIPAGEIVAWPDGEVLRCRFAGAHDPRRPAVDVAEMDGEITQAPVAAARHGSREVRGAQHLFETGGQLSQPGQVASGVSDNVMKPPDS